MASVMKVHGERRRDEWRCSNCGQVLVLPRRNEPVVAGPSAELCDLAERLPHLGIMSQAEYCRYSAGRAHLFAHKKTACLYLRCEVYSSLCER